MYTAGTGESDADRQPGHIVYTKATAKEGEKHRPTNRNEVQEIKSRADASTTISSGTFTLSFNYNTRTDNSQSANQFDVETRTTTRPIAYNAAADDVKDAKAQRMNEQID